MVSYDLLLLMLKIETSTGGINSVPFLVFRRDHLRSTSGIICGPIWRSFPAWGSFAVGDHLRRCTSLVDIWHLILSWKAKKKKKCVSQVLAVMCMSYTINSVIVTTSHKRPPPVSDHFVITVLFLSQMLFLELSRRRALLKFLKRARPVFRPEVSYILLFSVSGKRLPN